MKLDMSLPVNGSREKLWGILTNIENSPNTITGIEKVEVLEKPESGIVGLKWIETRTMFGKTATETMWITEAEENKYYKTKAVNHGMEYVSQMAIDEENGQLLIRMQFEGKPLSFGAKLMSGFFSLMFKGATKKAIMKDLEDIKKAMESEPPNSVQHE